MSSISSLLQALPNITQSRMIGSGYGLWMTWNGQLNNSLMATLKDYGLIPMVKESNQALWYSSSTEIFRALARLLIYARLNPTPVFCQVMPVTFQAGYNLACSLSVPAEFTKQSVEPSDEFEVWVHPKLQDDVKRIAGLELREKTGITGLSNSGWMMFVADEGLNYETALCWYCAIKPVGRMREKEAVMGWRGYLEEIRQLLQRHKIKYLIGTREEMVLLPLNNLRELRNFFTDLLTLSLEIKPNEEGNYWPSVIAAVPQKNLQFAEEVAGKFNVDWNKLSPDVPHLHYRDAYMVSEWFQINEARYGGEESLESWCNIGLKAESGLVVKAAVDLALPRTLVMGTEEKECYYCGLHNHAPMDCPSKAMPHLRPGVWNLMAKVNIKELPKAVKKLEDALVGDEVLKTISEMLETGKEMENKLLQVVFEINSPCQLRALTAVWRARGKEWPEGFKQSVEEDGQFVQDALTALKANEFEVAAEELKRARVKYPRSFIPSSLQGFLSLETGDFNQAMF
ncbi:MAG: tetratricopeptide repeat protein, partial [Proteobacteria bacterium]|nr:tetratricopeptide repeat protein [Pseudomonadota bacterium]